MSLRSVRVLKFGKKFTFGYVYYGKVHKHWHHCYYSDVCGCTFYWCPCTSCCYWWCEEAGCYYPYGYCPPALVGKYRFAW
jgi:hypothetical protein